MNKKVLFVGDLRPARNYGAIATSEALMAMVQKYVDSQNLRVIDFRSLIQETPEGGWTESVENYMEKIYEPDRSIEGKIKIVLERMHLLNAILKFKRMLKKTTIVTQKQYLPNTWREYPIYAQKVLQGECLKYEKKLLEWADIIIVNSEGNIVHGTSSEGKYRIGGRYVLFLEYLSKQVFNKDCYVINHTVDPQNRDVREIIQNVYRQLKGVVVRERMSLALLENWGVKNGKYIPDALFSYNFEKNERVYPEGLNNVIDIAQPYICIGDSSGILNNFEKVSWDVIHVYNEMIQSLREICPQIIFVDGFGGYNKEINYLVESNHLGHVHLNNCNYKQLYWILKDAKIFISGRWHASIISLCAHTPIILWGADSHKTEALYELLDYPFWFFDIKTIPLNIDRLVEEAKKVLKTDFSELWSQVELLKNNSLNNVYMLKNE